MATIFSKIAAGEIPSYRVGESDRYYLYDLDDETLSGMIIFAKQIAQKIKAFSGCNKVATVVLGLEVPHAHIHLIPINSEKDVDFSREKLVLTPEEFEEIASKLRG